MLTGLALAGAFGLAFQAVRIPLICLLASVAAGGAQKAFALRVAFDAAQFNSWAERWTVNAVSGDAAVADTSIRSDLLAFDQALAAMGVRRAGGGSVRELDSRIDGARKLFGLQLMAIGAQAVAWILAILTLQL